ncbi:hypothetical protein ANN_23291 [Periplaneta americana]|uniref:Ig-like domain-containing protein n=1 Tax=Periplaneta americana TaxID=6978 RepID=A0ABQ8SL54_PERAM|nr:hypothetical protein ANN_23291 [Periplaneta americana]
MCGVYGEDCMDRSNISRWCEFFADDRENFCHSPRFGRPVIAASQRNVTGILEDVPVDEIDGVCVCDIPLFKYARLTSCDVERSFSQYKSSFRDNRHAFVMENLEMTFVVHCNSRPTTSTQVWLVSWIRRKDYHLLTVGLATYSSDDRFLVEHARHLQVFPNRKANARRRMERVKWTDRIRNEAVLERMVEERIMLKLIRKRKINWLGHWVRRKCLLKDALEGMVNRRRVRGRTIYQMIDDIKIYGSYEKTKKKSENRKDCVPQESRSRVSPHGLHGALGDGARRGEERGGCDTLFLGREGKADAARGGCARIFCLPREAEKSVEVEISRTRTFQKLWLNYKYNAQVNKEEEKKKKKKKKKINSTPRRTHRHDTTVHDVIRLLIPALYKNQSDSLMAADGDCHHLCKLMEPVRHRWNISDDIVEIRNTVMPSDCPELRFGIRSDATIRKILAYTNFLENTIPHVLEDTPLINRQHIHFLHDGASVDKNGSPVLLGSKVPDLECLSESLLWHVWVTINTPGIWDRVRRSMRHRCESVFKQEVDILNIFCNDNRPFLGKKNVPNWGLQIKYVQPRDAGLYECQVSTHPPTSIFVELKVIVWNVALYGAGTWTLRRSEEKRQEEYEMRIWIRMKRVKWTD